MNISNFVIERLEPDTVIADFDCGDDDLNSFLANDAAAYEKERFAATHFVCLKENGKSQIAGYFSLLTDKLVFDPSDEAQRKEWRAFNKQNRIHFNKHRKTYPSVKVGRLAVDKHFAGKGLGRVMMTNIVAIIVGITDVACRFITVDAYKSAFDFYLKNDFRFLSDEDADDETQVMYFDIKRFAA
jgi:GNAT superfamily N-acetyltransferase